MTMAIVIANSQTVQWAVRPDNVQLDYYGRLMKVRKNGKIGLVDMKNHEVVHAVYDSITPFVDGYALVMNRVGRQLKIEAVLSEGDYELQPVSEAIYATRYSWFSDGKMPVKGSEGWGYLGTDGNMVIPCQFQRAYPFSEGFASVLVDDKAYYIDRNMDYLSVEAGYGNIVFGSTFLGGEAIVYSGESYKPKGYVINRRGRIIRPYKVKSEELKTNSYDHSVGDRSLHFSSKIKGLEENKQFSSYREGNLYGYKKNGTIIVPAQFDMAEPVYGNYAQVTYKGHNGILQMLNGNINVELVSREIKVSDDEEVRGDLQLSMPAELQDAPVKLRLLDEHENDLSVYAGNTQGRNRYFSFTPSIKPNESIGNDYKIEVWCENLLLMKSTCHVEYTVEKNVNDDNQTDKKDFATPRTNTKPVIRIASMSLSAPKATSKRANPKHNFFVTVSVTNSGDERGNADVFLYVDGTLVGNKNISVRGHGSSNAIFSVSGVKKERYAKVKATLKNGKDSHEANIHFMPFD